MLLSFRAKSVVRFACSGCGMTSMAGTRRVRRNCSICAGMNAEATSSHGDGGTIPLDGLDAAGITQRQGRWHGGVDKNLQHLPLRPGHVRAPGKVANAFAVESL